MSPGRGRQPGRQPGRPGGSPPRRGSRAGAPARRERPATQLGLGGEQVEGRQAVRELLSAHRRKVRELWVAEGIEESAVITDILHLATRSRVPIRMVSRAKLDARAITDAPQGVVARAAALEEADLDDLVRPTGGRLPFLIAVDGVTDPHNLGALLRSAECAGATGAVLPRHRAVHITPAVTKAAAGAIEHLPMAVVSGLPTALTRLRRDGVWSVGLDGDAEQSLFDMELGTEPVALILGAEGSGLSRLVRQRCDVVVGIPQRGSVPSLNVAAAGAVACYEVARRRPR